MRTKGVFSYSLRGPLLIRVLNLVVTFILTVPLTSYGVPNNLWEMRRNAGGTSTVAETSATFIDPSKCIVPENFGAVTERFTSRGTANSKKLIIQIQDSHCNYEAQSNIARMFETFENDREMSAALKLIAVEGGAGNVDTSFMRLFPDAVAKEKATDYLMKTGWLTAAEYYSANTKRDPVPVWGVEDKRLYDKNLNYFRLCKKSSAKKKAFFDRLSPLIDALALKVFSADARGLIEQKARWERNTIKFTEYCNYIADYAVRKGIVGKEGAVFHNTVSYPNISTVMETLHLELTMDRSRIDRERAEMIGDLQRKLVREELSELIKQSLYLRTGKIPAGKFYQYLRDVSAAKKLDMAKYPNLAVYMEIVLLHDRLNPSALFDEVERLETAVKEKTFTDRRERELNGIIDDVRTLGNLLDLRMSRKDLARYNDRKEGVAIDGLLNRLETLFLEAGVKTVFSRSLVWLRRHADIDAGAAVAFYNAALERDEMLVTKTIELMNKSKAAAVAMVAGGFHTQGMKELFKRKGYSYIVVMPRITKQYDDELYLSRMLNKQSEFEQMFSGIGSHLAPEPASLNPEERPMLEGMFLTVAHMEELQGKGTVSFSCKESKTEIELSSNNDGTYAMTSTTGGVTRHEVVLVNLTDRKISVVRPTAVATKEGRGKLGSGDVFEKIMQEYQRIASENSDSDERANKLLTFVRGLNENDIFSLSELYEQRGDTKVWKFLLICAQYGNEHAKKCLNNLQPDEIVSVDKIVNTQAVEKRITQRVASKDIDVTAESLAADLESLFEDLLPMGPGSGDGPEGTGGEDSSSSSSVVVASSGGESSESDGGSESVGQYASNGDRLDTGNMTSPAEKSDQNTSGTSTKDQEAAHTPAMDIPASMQVAAVSQTNASKLNLTSNLDQTGDSDIQEEGQGPVSAKTIDEPISSLMSLGTQADDGQRQEIVDDASRGDRGDPGLIMFLEGLRDGDPVKMMIQQVLNTTKDTKVSNSRTLVDGSLPSDRKSGGQAPASIVAGSGDGFMQQSEKESVISKKSVEDSISASAAHPVGVCQDISDAAKKEILERPAQSGSREIFTKKDFLRKYPALADAMRSLPDDAEVAIDIGAGSVGKKGAVVTFGYSEQGRSDMMPVKALNAIVGGKSRICMTQAYLAEASKTEAFIGIMAHEIAHVNGKSHTQAVLDEYAAAGLARIILDFTLAAKAGAAGEAYLASVQESTGRALQEILGKVQTKEITAEEGKTLERLAVILEKFAAVMRLTARLNAIAENSGLYGKNAAIIKLMRERFNSLSSLRDLKEAEALVLEMASFMPTDGGRKTLTSIVDKIVQDPENMLGQMTAHRVRDQGVSHNAAWVDLEKQLQAYFAKYGLTYERDNRTVNVCMQSLMEALRTGEKKYLDTSIIKGIRDMDQLLDIMHILNTYYDAGGQLIIGDATDEQYGFVKDARVPMFEVMKKGLFDKLGQKGLVQVKERKDLAGLAVQKIEKMWVKDGKVTYIGFMVSARYLNDYATFLDTLKKLVSLLVSDEKGNVTEVDIELIKAAGLTEIAQKMHSGDLQLIEIFDVGERTFNDMKNASVTLIHA